MRASGVLTHGQPLAKMEGVETLAREMRVKLRHVREEVDRHGNVRIYVRVKGKQRVRIRAMPGTPEFLAAYDAAIKTIETGAPRQAAAVKHGSLRSLCIAYYASAKFKALDLDSTQSWQRRSLDEICQTMDDKGVETLGVKPVALMQPRHVRKIRDTKSDTPAAANQRLKALRALFNWANEAEETSNNPTIGVKGLKYATSGHYTWTIEDVEQYEERHTVGTKARLAMALLLYTSWRREDAVRLGPQHIVKRKLTDGGVQKRIKYRQAKNEHRNPVDMDIPLLPDLEEVIDAAPSGHLTFLVTEYGNPFTANGFGNKFKDWCREAGLPQCSAHGLRKACATRLAQRGASPWEIMAITGHKTLEEVERYTRAVTMSALADSAAAKLK